MVIMKDTTKTGATVVADLKLCPLVMKVLSLVAPDKRVGPLIIDEKSGRPYAEDGYAREWRIVATSRRHSGPRQKHGCPRRRNLGS